MGQSIKYYLVARDRKTNEFEIVKVNGKRSNSLEDIDLYTMSHSDSLALSRNLNKEGDYDYFIVNQSKRGQEVSINKQEVIYANSSKLRDIAVNSKNKRIGFSELEITAIIEEFCRKMSYDTNYYRLTTDGRNHIYQKLIKYFYFSRYHSAEELKRKDGGWITKSYPLIRNIVDSLLTDYTSSKHLSDEMYRNVLNKKLVRVTDPDYDENQISLFDLFPDQKQDNTDEVLEIMTTIDNLPFEVVENEELLAKLPVQIRSTIRQLIRSKYYHESAPVLFEEEYHKRVITAQSKIIKALEEKDVLKGAYDWCMLYNKSVEKVSGDSNGYSYTKGNKQ